MSDLSKIVEDILNQEGQDMVDEIRENLAATGSNASGKTSESIRYEVEIEGKKAALSLFGRGYIMSVETGRGPRQSSKESNFLDGMKDWMKIKGIGSGLTQKKFDQLARFFTFRQNKLGSLLFRRGGRKDIITPVISAERVREVSDRVIKVYADDLFKAL